VWDIEQVGVMWFSTEPDAELQTSRATVSGPALSNMPYHLNHLPPRAERPGRLVLWRAATRMLAAHPVAGVGPDNFRLTYRQYAPLVHAPIGGPWAFGPRPAYIAARRQDRPDDLGASTQYLVRRYLEGFGPASIRDIAQFSTMLRPPIRAAVAALGTALVRHDGPDGELYDLPEGALPEEDVHAPPRLLPMWDSVLLAYADRSRVIPAEYRRAVIRTNGDVLPTLLVDGSIAGVWRASPEGIEAIAFRALPKDAWAGLAAEAARLVDFLAAREPVPYRRFGRWYEGLPSVEVRLLGR
jgi:hypothetical protein